MRVQAQKTAPRSRTCWRPWCHRRRSDGLALLLASNDSGRLSRAAASSLRRRRSGLRLRRVRRNVAGYCSASGDYMMPDQGHHHRLHLLGDRRLPRRRHHRLAARHSSTQPRHALDELRRLRPLHTSAVIFAFGGNVLIGTSLYVVQRTCHARLPGRWAPWFVGWGYQLFIVIAGTGYPLASPGRSTRTRMVPDLCADDRLGCVPARFPRHPRAAQGATLYVANWFYLAFIVTIAMLHVVNNLTIRELVEPQELHCLLGCP